jgi:hypothetical protein
VVINRGRNVGNRLQFEGWDHIKLSYPDQLPDPATTAEKLIALLGIEAAPKLEPIRVPSLGLPKKSKKRTKKS